MGDIATIVEASADARNAARFNGKPAVLVAVSRLPDANIVDTSNRVYEAVEKLRGWMPAGVSIEVQTERTSMIRATVDHVGVILSVTVGLAVLVVALFLRRFWATIIPGLAIPVALAGTLAGIHQLGFTLNTMSLMALTVAIGFIVDDAIVVVDAVAHRRDLGEGRVDAAINGSRQIGFTIVSMSASLVAAFIPLLFMEDFLGRIMAEFSVTVVVAILVSGVVALTLTPTLCGRLISAREGEGTRRGRVVDAYVRALTFALRHKLVSLAVVFGCVLSDRRGRGDGAARVVPAPGHRRGLVLDRGIARHLVQGDGRAHPRGGDGSSRRRRDQEHQRLGILRSLGVDQHHAQAAGRADRHSGSGRGAPASQAGGDTGGWWRR